MTQDEYVEAYEAGVKAERERAAEIADLLADHWQATGEEHRKQFTVRSWFGFGKPRLVPFARRDLKTVDAAVHGLRTVARLIRSGATRRDQSSSGQ